MQSIRGLFLGGLVLAAALQIVHAQLAVSLSETAQPIAEATDETSAVLQALTQITPQPATGTPEAGNFYTFQHGQDWPPLPGNVLNLPFWSLGDNFFVLDDRNVDYAELQAEAEAAAALVEAAAPMMRMSMMSSLSSSYAYSNPVYLTNMAAVIAYDGSTTASFSIAGGTNFVPYDILMTTNLLSPIDWTWLGIGYTSNNYTFYSQSSDNAFYRLAKPSKTMVVAWGENYFNQCDVPSGITNAMMVAGGGGYTMALLNNGTVVGWGGRTTEGSVPTNQTGVAMIASGINHKVILLTNGTVLAWGDNLFGETSVPSNLTNATVISAQFLHTLALRNDGTVVSWGDIYSTSGLNTVPSGLSNVVAIAAGGDFNIVAKADGTVTAWGDNTYHECDIPTGLSNVVDVAAGDLHSVALKSDGTVVAWGDDTYGATDVPAGLSNVVAIAACGYPDYCSYTLALKSDGTVAAWGENKATAAVQGLSNVIAIGAEYDSGLAIRSGPPTPVITLAPVDHYQAVGSTATFTARGAGLYGVTYQWQTNGVNLAGATNTTLTVTNVQTTSATNYAVVVTDNVGMGSIVSSNANLYLVTAPVITYQSTPTNILCIYGNYVAMSATASAPGQFNGFPLSYQWKYNGTNISGATGNTYGFFATNAPGTYSLVVSNAAGSASASWQVANTNAINVTNDLLLVYNSNSADSSNLCAYYLAHRPMVGGANVLGVACDTNEAIAFTNYLTQIANPVLNWLTNNPTKRPQYVVLFYGIPTQLQSYPIGYGSIAYNLRLIDSNWQPLVNNINAGSLADCEAYVDKIASFGSNYSPGQLVISASAGGYGNTNYVVDNVRNGSGHPDDFTGFGSVVASTTNGLLASGVSTAAILYSDGLEIISNSIVYNLAHSTSKTNVAGYICWGAHSSLGSEYATNGTVQWHGNSSWWLIETVESWNGTHDAYSGQGNFTKWFSSNAFGGTNYSHTPVGAVCHVFEPNLSGVNDAAIYFRLWASAKNFGVCAWTSRLTPYFQAVGDPFVTQ